MEVLDKGMSHIPGAGWLEVSSCYWEQCATAHGRVISGFSHLMCLDHGQPWVARTMGSKTTDKEGFGVQPHGRVNYSE